jgi:8-oxo-dGTP pyrophosphatase MutT (NUDIX family)
MNGNGVDGWVAGDRRELARTRILRVCEQRFECTADPARSGAFTVIETADWVNAIALTPDGGEGPGVVMVEQFRYGTGAVTLELPGGMVDTGEDPVVAAVRELREETGFAGGAARILGRLDANPAILTNRVTTVVVEGARPVGAAEPDQHELIGVRVIPLPAIPGLIARGEIAHSVIVAAFCLFFLDRGVVGPIG